MGVGIHHTLALAESCMGYRVDVTSFAKRAFSFRPMSQSHLIPLSLSVASARLILPPL